jgi:hypothetical protein
VARIYAAVMALLAMLVILLRAMKDHSGFDGTIASALVWMVIFGLIGFVVGSIGQTTVDESVLSSVAAQLSAPTPKQNPEFPTSTS